MNEARVRIFSFGYTLRSASGSLRSDLREDDLAVCIYEDNGDD